MPPEIRIRDLHKSFGDHAVLRGIDLEIGRGEMVAIVGGSGCGKTVLLHHVIGHLQPDRGRVWVADHEQAGGPLVEITDMDPTDMDRIRIHSAVVFQRNALFSASVFENIALWLREVKHVDEATIRARAREALDDVGFAGDATILSKERHELSGGMAKRVALARALAMQPVVLYYDEPTTGLDPRSAAHIHELIRETHARPAENGRVRTTVIVTHDKDLLYRLEPRVIMLHEGVVHFDGTYDAFEASESEIIRPYFEVMPALHERKLPV